MQVAGIVFAVGCSLGDNKHTDSHTEGESREQRRGERYHDARRRGDKRATYRTIVNNNDPMCYYSASIVYLICVWTRRLNNKSVSHKRLKWRGVCVFLQCLCN